MSTKMHRTSKDVYKKYLSEDWVDQLYTNALKDFEAQVVPILANATYVYYPTHNYIFRAFHLTTYKDTKVVILGQDPYFDGSATGLAFDNNFRLKRPVSPSLRNIIKECEADTGFTNKSEQYTSYLQHWAEQGVLLLNTALTVKRKAATSHSKMWVGFTDNVIKRLNKKDHIVWMLWGAHAQNYKDKINPEHTILTSSHPSPLAATKTGEPFIGCRHFSKANKALHEHKQEIIIW